MTIVEKDAAGQCSQGSVPWDPGTAEADRTPSAPCLVPDRRTKISTHLSTRKSGNYLSRYISRRNAWFGNSGVVIDMPVTAHPTGLRRSAPIGFEEGVRKMVDAVGDGVGGVRRAGPTARQPCGRTRTGRRGTRRSRLRNMSEAADLAVHQDLSDLAKRTPVTRSAPHARRDCSASPVRRCSKSASGDRWPVLVWVVLD